MDKSPLFILNLMIRGAVLLILDLGWRLGNYMRGCHNREGKAPMSSQPSLP